ncbi:MAG: hypothetical protein ACOCZK_07650 [Planctomycetota bacterium]
MSRPLAILLSATLGLPATAVAADDAAPPRGQVLLSAGRHPWTLRAELGFGDGDLTTEYDPGGDGSVDQDYRDTIASSVHVLIDRHFRADRRWGWHLGGGYFINGCSGELAGDVDDDYLVAHGAVLVGGLVYHPKAWLRCDLGLRLYGGTAIGSYDQQLTDDEVESSDGYYAGLAAVGGAYLQLLRVELGLVATYGASMARVSFDDVTFARDGAAIATGDLDATYHHHGAQVMMSMGVNLGPAMGPAWIGSETTKQGDPNGENPWSARIEMGFGPGIETSEYAFANAGSASRSWSDPWSRHYALLLERRFRPHPQWGWQVGGGVFLHDAFGDEDQDAGDQADHDFMQSQGLTAFGGGHFRPAPWARITLGCRACRGESTIHIHDGTLDDSIESLSGEYYALELLAGAYGTWNHFDLGVVVGYLDGESEADFADASFARGGTQFVDGEMEANCSLSGFHYGLSFGVAW